MMYEGGIYWTCCVHLSRYLLPHYTVQHLCKIMLRYCPVPSVRYFFSRGIFKGII